MADPLAVLLATPDESAAAAAEAALAATLGPCAWRRARTADEYRRALAAEPPDLVVFDPGLPGLDGTAALELARRAAPGAPFLAFAVGRDEDAALDCLAAGADDYALWEHPRRLGPAAARALAARQDAALLQGQAEVLERIAAGAPLAETLAALVRLIEAQADGLLGSVLLLDPDGVHVRHGAAPSLPEAFVRAVDGEPIGPRAGSCGTAAYRREAVVVEDIATDPLWQDYRALALAHGLRACWSTPIFDEGGTVLGTFALYFRAPRRPTDRHRRLIARATHVAAIAIAKAREAAARREGEGWLRAAVAAADVGLWEWDLATNRVRFSAEWKRQIGYEEGEIADDFAEWQSRVHPDDLERCLAIVRAYLADPWPDYRLEFRLRHRDGSYRWILAQASLLRDAAGAPVRMLGSHLDITERKRAEAEIRQLNESLEQRVQDRTRELAAANRELEAFSYSVSHDLRAPLRAIDGFPRILEEDHGGGLGPEGQRVCGVVRDNTRRMGQLIDDLLALARVGRQALVAEAVDMAGLARAAYLELTEPGARERVEFRLGALPPALGDPGLLRQVWINLLGNALKFSAGRTRAVIEVEGEAGEGEVCYRVRDNGAGFDGRLAGRLFTPFQRLHGPGEFEGSGVGLALVQRIVHRHGGRVGASGEEGKGAEFSFALPHRAPGA